MGIELDKVWEIPITKKLAYGEHLNARDKFENYLQRVVQAQHEEEMDFEDMDLPDGVSGMPDMSGEMPNMPSMGNSTGASSTGNSDIHPALKKYANSKSGKIVNVVGDPEEGNESDDE